jgi:prolyl oligopeptidase
VHDAAVSGALAWQRSVILQAAQGCAKPTLIRVETKASHGYRPTDKQIAEAADMVTFMGANTGLLR